jgi:hypothetical protein
LKLKKVNTYKVHTYLFRMKFITVKPRLVDDENGEEEPFCDEVGTPVFYMVDFTLQKYLGENIFVYIERLDGKLFTIQHIPESLDYIRIINNINEPNTLQGSNRHTHIRFEIVENL